MHYPIPPDPPPGCPECGDDIVEVGDHVRCDPFMEAAKSLADKNGSVSLAELFMIREALASTRMERE